METMQRRMSDDELQIKIDLVFDIHEERDIYKAEAKRAREAEKRLLRSNGEVLELMEKLEAENAKLSKDFHWIREKRDEEIAEWKKEIKQIHCDNAIRKL